MAKSPKWTEEEKSILIQAVQANPHNLQEAFRQAEIQLDRTNTAISNCWYYKLKRQSVCFVTVSPKKKLENGKLHFKENHSKPTINTVSIWDRIKRLLGF